MHAGQQVSAKWHTLKKAASHVICRALMHPCDEAREQRTYTRLRRWSGPSGGTRLQRQSGGGSLKGGSPALLGHGATLSPAALATLLCHLFPALAAWCRAPVQITAAIQYPDALLAGCFRKEFL